MTKKANKNNGRVLEYGDLTTLAGYQIRLAQVAVFRDFEHTLKPLELTPTLYGSLVLVQANPGMKQTDLAGAVQLDRSTVVSVVDRLEARGLVERRRANDDRRSNALHITAAGKRLLKQAAPLVVDHETRMVAGLTHSERAIMTTALSKIFPEKR
jgi:DNA-binding MarR family transcriptional regulator